MPKEEKQTTKNNEYEKNRKKEVTKRLYFLKLNINYQGS